MKTTIEQRKEKAIELLQKLDIYKPYINGFKKSNEICYYERFAGFWAWQDEKLTKKINEIEEKYHCTVYAVTHEYAEFGECFDFLIVPNDSDDWQDLISNYNQNTFYAFAYVWNKDDDYCSEFGDILIQSAFGGIRRIG